MQTSEDKPKTGKSPPISTVSDENLQKITGQIILGQTVLVAYSIGLFDVLLSTPMTVGQLMDQFNLSERAVQGMVSCACSMEFLESRHDVITLTSLGRQYFDKNSPAFYGGVLDLLIEKSEIMDFQSIRNAIFSDVSQVDKGKDIFSDESSLGSTEAFLKGLHHKAFSPAFFWSDVVDLSQHHCFIDIGGGSGIHTIAACLRNNHLKGVVCDRSPVLEYTDRYIKEFQLQDRISTQELDFWSSQYPEGDVYFMADIFHDWKKEQCALLAQKCYNSMANGGRIILHEMLFNDDKSGPPLTAAYHMKMLLWTQGQQYTFTEISSILCEAGFHNIRKMQGLGNWSLVIGEKPH